MHSGRSVDGQPGGQLLPRENPMSDRPGICSLQQPGLVFGLQTAFVNLPLPAQILCFLAWNSTHLWEWEAPPKRHPSQRPALLRATLPLQPRLLTCGHSLGRIASGGEWGSAVPVGLRAGLLCDWGLCGRDWSSGHFPHALSAVQAR